MGVTTGVGSGLGAGVGLGVGDGVGEGDGDGVGEGDGDGDGVVAAPTLARGGKSTTGMSARTGPIIHVQIRTGIEPPVICSKPPKGVISSASPFGPTWYMPTTPTCCGVKPTNQAERFSFDVPVLPAMGLPSSAAKFPDPDLWLITCCMA